MARPKKEKKAKPEFRLSQQAVNLIQKLHDLLVKEVTKFDKKSQKGNKK